MLNMAFDVLLSAVFVKYSKLEAFVLICTLLLKPNYSPSCRLIFILTSVSNSQFQNDLNEEGMITQEGMNLT